MYKVLIAENNPTTNKLLSHFFREEGCEICSVDDGLQALDMLETFVPDILCTDIIMPKIGGDQLCRVIRQTPRLKDIFIVVHSATSLEDDILLFEMEADLYIAKGLSVVVKQLVSLVIDRFTCGKRRENILHGVEGLHSRTITKELLLHKRHFLAIFDSQAVAMIEMDHTGRIVQANRAAQVLLDCHLSTLLASRLTDYRTGLRPCSTMVRRDLK